MQTVVIVILWITASSLAASAIMVTAEIVAARRPRRGRRSVATGQRPQRVTILMPAHDEEAIIGDTVSRLMKNIGENDEILVVADNCTDATATVAHKNGARVIERHDPRRRGKGYALEFGRQHLASAPPDAVIVMDADCHVAEGSLESLARFAVEVHAPTQAIYVMDAAPGTAAAGAISAFAVHVKNHLRPLGLTRLGGPCLLLGSGMAFPWPLFAQMRLDHSNVVEDMQLAVDMALAGTPPRLCEDVTIRSSLPETSRAARTQRTRWEHGHLLLILTQAPRLLMAGVLRGRPSLVALGAELAVPPLSLLTITLALTTAASAGAAIWWQHYGPLVLCVLTTALLVASLGGHWTIFRRAQRLHVGPWSLARYIAAKIPIYAGFPLSRQREWVRTPRTKPTLDGPPQPAREDALVHE